MASEQTNAVTPSICQTAGPPPKDALTDRQLLERFVAARDETAFATLLERHGPMVMSVCGRLLHDVHEAEDAFQATFLVLVHKAQSIGRPELLGPWLHGVANRTSARALQVARRRARQRETVIMPESDPAIDVMWRELREVLDEELGRLALKYRAPLVLFYLEGKTTDAVALQLGCPKGTVLSRLARGRERLRNRLVRRGVGLSVCVMVSMLTEKAMPSAVPAALALGTVKAAVLTATGQAAAGAIPTTVAALTKGVLRTMLLNNLKVAGVVLMIAAAVAGTSVCARLALADKPVVAGKDQPPKDEEKILGTWTIVSMKEGGQKATEEAIKDAKVTFAAEGKMTSKQGAKEQKFTYKLDPGKKPKEFSGTNDKGQTVLGIYKLEGDDLTLCFERRGNRPMEFASKEGTTVVLEVLKREKK